MRILCIILLLFVMVSVECNKKKMKVKLVKADRCEVPPGKLDTSAPISWDLWTRQVDRDNAVFNVNISVTEKFGPVTFSGRAYQTQSNSAKALVFKLEKVSCHNPVIFQLMKLGNPKFDNNCVIDAGVYTLENLNVEILRWIISKTVTTAGIYTYELDYSGPKGVAVCLMIICDVKIGGK